MAEVKLGNPFSSLDAFGRRRLVQVVTVLIIALGVYFLSAGRIDLPWGWVYLGVGLVSLVVGGAYVLRYNPQAINERGRPAESQKAWDKVILACYTPLFILVYVVAGLDARFTWTQDAPFWLHALGVLVSFLSGALTYAAMAHNPFLAQVVQIADQRGHRVATGGPYHFIRHPMYASLILSWPALAFLFGSYWALIPAGLASLLIIVRTVFEDRTLLAELPGYQEYAAQTRYRLLPRVW
jgi:protein-S-isoprenylcysteine O-methyltransferase Ste14